MSNKIDFPQPRARVAVIMARVSTREQEDGYSIEAQKYRLQNYCERQGLEVIKVFEIVESSTKGDRRKFMDMIKFCKSQRQPVAIVADKVDRVQRSFREYPLLDDLIRSNKIELHFNTEGYVIHSQSASAQRLMWSVGVVVSQSFVDSLRDNVKRAIDQKIRQGEYVSRAPLGYLNVRDTAGRADIVLDEARAPLVRRIFTEYATGLYTLMHLVREAKSWGLRTREGKPLSRAQLYEMLNNPFYCGMMRIKGQILAHRYSPLIDKSLFDACRGVMKGWHKKPFMYGKKEYVFRGLVTCKTNGKTVTTFTKTKTNLRGGGGKWTYMRSWDSAGKFIYIPEEKVMAQAEAAIRALTIPQDVVKAITEVLRTTSHLERDFLRRQATELHNEQDRLQARTTSLMEMHMDGMISRAEFEKQKALYDARKIEITQELAANQQGDDGFKNAILKLIDICNQAPDLFASSTTSEKRRLINFLLENLALDGTTLCFDYKQPFKEFVSGKEKEKWCQWAEGFRTNPELRRAVITAITQENGLMDLLLSVFSKARDVEGGAAQ